MFRCLKSICESFVHTSRNKNLYFCPSKSMNKSIFVRIALYTTAYSRTDLYFKDRKSMNTLNTKKERKII